MKIAVLIKQVPDTWGDRHLDLTTGRVDRTDGEQVIDEINERALEAALSYRDQHAGSTVVAVSMGPASTTAALRKALSIGADSAVHVLDDKLYGADAPITAAALAGALNAGQYDLILAGNVSTDGRSGAVPAMIAQHLDLPQLSTLDTVDISDHEVTGTRTTDFGVQTVRSGLPALITVTEQLPEARFPGFKSIMAAKKKPLTTLSLGDLNIEPGLSASRVISVAHKAAREAGRIVVDDGTAANQLAEFLTAEHLV